MISWPLSAFGGATSTFTRWEFQNIHRKDRSASPINTNVLAGKRCTRRT